MPLDNLAVLLELTRRLAEESSLENALRAVTDAALELLPGDHASVRLFDDSRSELLAGARSGVGADSRPPMFRPGQGISGWVAQTGIAARVGDAESDPRFVRTPNQAHRVRSVLATPLWSGGKVVGVLSVSSPAVDVFSAHDEDLARLLANCATPPIERARLQRLAITDSHTRLFNRRYLYPRLEEEMERARRHVIPLSLLLLDLDRFKSVNDQHGHDVGDAVLTEFADRALLHVRRGDVLIRRGGEEFVLIMPSTGRDEAEVVAERIRLAMEVSPVQCSTVEVFQTVSIGVALWDGIETASELEKRADEAMYAAKRSGRNRVHASVLQELTTH